MAEEHYKPYSTNRFYPGRINDERKKALAKFQVPLDDLTTEDIVYNLGLGFTRTLYSLMDVVRDRFGPDAVQEVLEQWGHARGKARYGGYLKSKGVDHGSAELMAEFQDIAHTMGGPSMSTAYSEYDSDEGYCVVRRTSCGFHDPKAEVSLCTWAGGSHVKGYMEVDPAMKESDRPKCISRGDPYCERYFKFATDAE